MVKPHDKGEAVPPGKDRERRASDRRLARLGTEEHRPLAITRTGTRQPSGERVGYEEDFAAWAEGQAQILRHGSLRDVDVENVAEELEGLSRSERRALRSCLTLIVSHMLKLIYQPAKATGSWANTIHRERMNLERLLEDSPSLKAHLPKLFHDAYEDGRYQAAKETKLDLGTFPEDPVFSLEQTRDRDFMPAGGSVAIRDSDEV